MVCSQAMRVIDKHYEDKYFSDIKYCVYCGSTDIEFVGKSLSKVVPNTFHCKHCGKYFTVG